MTRTRSGFGAIVAVATLLAAVFSTALATDAAARGRTLTVDDDGAQCPGARYEGIQRAIDAAHAGDTVQVCGGIYTGNLTIGNGIDLVAKTPAAPAVNCLAAAAPFSGRLTVVHGGITVTGTGARVDGLVVTGAAIGITTSEHGSGYRIRRNLVIGNTHFGIELQSSGKRSTVVEKNCLRGNAAGNIVSEAGALRRAVIRSNTIADGPEAISALGPHPRYDVSIARNIVRRVDYGVLVSGTIGGDITANDIDLAGQESGVLGAGVLIAGGNLGLTIAGNTISNVFGTGIYFQRELANDIDTRTSVGLLLARNSLRNNVGSGVRVEIPATGRPANLTSSLMYRNVADHSGVNGFAVTVGNDGNALFGNDAINNGRFGIALLGAADTAVVGNSLSQNGVADAHDDTVGRNHWIGNTCVTDQPVGAICTAADSASTPSTIMTVPKIDLDQWPCLRVPVWDAVGGAWARTTVLAPDAPAGTSCGS